MGSLKHWLTHNTLSLSLPPCLHNEIRILFTGSAFLKNVVKRILFVTSVNILEGSCWNETHQSTRKVLLVIITRNFSGVKCAPHDVSEEQLLHKPIAFWNLSNNDLKIYIWTLEQTEEIGSAQSKMFCFFQKLFDNVLLWNGFLNEKMAKFHDVA